MGYSVEQGFVLSFGFETEPSWVRVYRLAQLDWKDTYLRQKLAKSYPILEECNVQVWFLANTLRSMRTKICE